MREKIQVRTLRRFERDYARLLARDQVSPEDFAVAVDYFLAELPLPSSWQDHALTAEWQGCREFHLFGARNTLIIYRMRDNEVIFVAMGTHQSLFPHRKWKRKGTLRKSTTPPDQLIEQAIEAVERAGRVLKRWWQVKK